MRKEPTVVPTAVGDLRAAISLPDSPGPHIGIVLVDGSGDGVADGWGPWPGVLTGCGAVVLTHDKPGCGGSPGDWTMQTFEDRARESLSALAVLRSHPEVAGSAGLFGVSQGGWVALLAATLGTAEVDFVISVSGPGVSPRIQERWRIEQDLRSAGLPREAIVDALHWVDERTRRLLDGEPVETVLGTQAERSDESWYDLTTRQFDTVEALGFLVRVLAFEPADVLPRVPCPVLALFGADDTLVPVSSSVIAFATHLPERPGQPHGIAVLPRADHGLFTAAPAAGVDRADQLAAGAIPMIRDFVAAVDELLG
jgi:pimeloyl-ACP methyl ester carboxylesterase